MNSKRGEVRLLTPAAAVELGADVTGEVFIFAVAAGVLLNEYNQQTAKNEKKEAKLAAQLERLEKGMAGAVTDFAKIAEDIGEAKRLLEEHREHARNLEYKILELEKHLGKKK